MLHKEIAMMSGFQELEVLEKRSDKPMEYEANLFAAELLLEDKNVLETLNEYTFFETASILNVPAALLDFKFAILKTKGYRINDLQIAKSHFLKEDLGVYEGNNSPHC
jgi:Zn-dependent peptidase ImmA (M78 family)